MPDLRALFRSLGGEDVTTYVQSGNVVFKSAEGSEKLIATIERRIRRDLGLTVTVLLRTKPQLAKVVAGNPFAKGVQDPTKLHVTFLAKTPNRSRARRLDAEHGEPGEFRVAGREIYLHCPNGYGRSKLTNAYFEQELGLAATTRSWKSVTKLAELTGT